MEAHYIAERLREGALFLAIVIIFCSIMLAVAIRELANRVERQFKRHDADLRAEVERVNRNFRELITEVREQ